MLSTPLDQPTIGRPILRVEGRDKVLGKLKFTADHTLPNLAHAVLVQSTIPHGTFSEEHLAAAVVAIQNLPGVLHVLTPANCPELHHLPADLTDDLPSERRPPLSDNAILYAGQHLALVVAETLDQATFAAQNLLLPGTLAEPVLSATALLGKPASKLTEYGTVRHGSYAPDHFTKLKAEKLQYTRGQPNPAAEAVRIAETYSTPVVHHNPMELSSTIASWDGDHLTLHDTTRWIMGSRKTIAAYLHLPEENIRVLAPFVGGAFGSKGFLWQHVVLAAIAARTLARPVKLVVTRAQMFTSVGHRPAVLQQLTLAANSAGKLTTVEHHTLSETSVVSQFTEPCGLTSRNLYSSPHVTITHHVARLNKPTPCFMRAPGEASGVFALESAIDELALALHLDPLDLRRRNHAATDEDGPKPWSGKHLLECYDTAASTFGWQHRNHTPRSMTRSGKQVGYGMATATYPARRMAAGCRATLTRDGHAHFFTATHELGTGLRTVMSQLAADTLGLPFDHVRFLSGDSDFPQAPYTGASQTSATVGSAVRQAALLLRGRLCALATEDPASPLHGLPPQSVTLANGILSGPGATHREPWQDLLARASDPPPSPKPSPSKPKPPRPPLDKLGFQSFGAHFCEVEVDEQLGKAKITRWSGAFDGGTILNPTLARNQIAGGIIFGIGMALMEETHYDPATALAVNPNLAEYHLPTIADVPDFDISFIEHPDLNLDPFGARGIGELGIVGAAAAIANAIHHATGKRLRQLPITADHLLAPPLI